jgi:hypothetical protein
VKHAKPEERFVARVREVLEESAAKLDGGTRARLAGLRRSALASGQAREASSPRLWLRWPIWAAAATLALVATVYFTTPRPTPEQMAASAAEDLEIVTAADGLEFYEQLDFYTWLAEDGNAV